MEFYGLDVHKRYSVFTCVDEQGCVLRRGRVGNSPEELVGVVAPSGGAAAVVLEATSNWAYVHDVLAPHVGRVVLAHPQRVKAIAAARVKTDAVDATTLAHLLRTDLIPAAYAAPSEVRDRREWLRARAGLVRMATQLKNRVHAQLGRGGVTPDRRSAVFTRAGRAWLAELPLRPAQRDVLERHLRLLDALAAETTACRAILEREARRDPNARLLMTVPGIGPLTALLFLAEVGDVHRFASARHLASYAGLAPTVRSSGGRTQLGGISHQGSAWLRWAFTEAAVRAATAPGPLADFHQAVRHRRGGPTATVALARKLLTVAYAVLRSGEPYRAAG